MRNILFTILGFTVFMSCSLGDKNFKSEKTRMEGINNVFSQIEKQGINTDQQMLYGYFFFDKNAGKLEKLKDRLIKDGFRFVRLDPTEKGNFILHVEKVEIHSRVTLLERELQFVKLAKEYDIELYDGFDVGNVDPTKPLSANDDFEKKLDSMTVENAYKTAMELYDKEVDYKAIVAFTNCVKRNYKMDTSLYKIGNCYINAKQPERGIETLEQAVKVNPKYTKAYFNIAATCYDLADYKKSAEYYEKAVKLDSKDDRNFYGLASAQFMLQQFKEAEANCKTSLKLNPNNENAKKLMEMIAKQK